MIDHFSLLAPFYEKLIPPPSPGEISDLLDLNPDSVLLDVAGGTGRVSAQFASVIARVVVCDSSEGMLCEARKKGLEAVLAEAEKLPFENSFFDCILLVDAFHHVIDQRAALLEMLRVLKPSGRLVIEEPDIQRPLVRVVAFLEKIFLMRSHFVKPVKMIEMLKEAGGHATLVRQDRFRIWLSVTPCLKTVYKKNE